VKEGWYEDPTGRHELRYWGGMTWTSAVNDAGRPKRDPSLPLEAPRAGTRAPDALQAASWGRAIRRDEARRKSSPRDSQDAPQKSSGCLEGCLTSGAFLFLAFLSFLVALAGYAPGDVASSGMKVGLWIAAIFLALAVIAGPIAMIVAWRRSAGRLRGGKNARGT
jgi:hypothetical protein